MHAVERAKERYGADLSASDLASLAAHIRSGHGLLLDSSHTGRTWAVRWRGQNWITVTPPDKFWILTFLPKGAYRYCRLRIMERFLETVQ